MPETAAAVAPTPAVAAIGGGANGTNTEVVAATAAVTPVRANAPTPKVVATGQPVTSATTRLRRHLHRPAGRHPGPTSPRGGWGQLAGLYDTNKDAIGPDANPIPPWRRPHQARWGNPAPRSRPAGGVDIGSAGSTGSLSGTRPRTAGPCRPRAAHPAGAEAITPRRIRRSPQRQSCPGTTPAPGMRAHWPRESPPESGPAGGPAPGWPGALTRWWLCVWLDTGPPTRTTTRTTTPAPCPSPGESARTARSRRPSPTPPTTTRARSPTTPTKSAGRHPQPVRIRPGSGQATRSGDNAEKADRTTSVRDSPPPRRHGSAHTVGQSIGDIVSALSVARSASSRPVSAGDLRDRRGHRRTMVPRQPRAGTFRGGLSRNPRTTSRLPDPGAHEDDLILHWDYVDENERPDFRTSPTSSRVLTATTARDWRNTGFPTVNGRPPPLLRPGRGGSCSR